MLRRTDQLKLSCNGNECEPLVPCLGAVLGAEHLEGVGQHRLLQRPAQHAVVGRRLPLARATHAVPFSAQREQLGGIKGKRK